MTRLFFVVWLATKIGWIIKCKNTYKVSCWNAEITLNLLSSEESFLIKFKNDELI